MCENLYEKDGTIYFKREWKCRGEEWVLEFKYKDLEGAAYTPICKRCFSGALFVS